jgi:hypothetical protein
MPTLDSGELMVEYYELTRDSKLFAPTSGKEAWFTILIQKRRLSINGGPCSHRIYVINH